MHVYGVVVQFLSVHTFPYMFFVVDFIYEMQSSNNVQVFAYLL